MKHIIMNMPFTTFKSRLAALSRRVAFCGLLWLAVAAAPVVFATNVAEGPDFPNATPGPATTLTVGTNLFSGTLTTPSDGQDRFNVTVPAGFRLAQVTKTFAAGGGVVSPNVNFNTEDLSGTGAGTFTNGYPLGPGTYSAIVSVGFSVGNAWTVTFTVEPLPNYTVTSASGAISITDDAGNSDTLNVSQTVAGTIKFAVTGRTFSVNNGPLLTNDSGNLSLSGIGSVTINAGPGNDTINIGALGTSFPSLIINGGTGDDTVNLNGNITFAIDKRLSVDLQDDDANPGVDSVNVAPGVAIGASGFGTITLKCSRSVTMSAGASLQTSYGSITIEANQQAVATTGNFNGVQLDGASLFCGGISLFQNQITVKGRGGNDPGGSQLGVYLVNGATITGGQKVDVAVTGTGGASANWINRGVTVYGAGSIIRTIDGTLNVTGTGGPNSSFYGIGVSVIWGGQISGAGGAGVFITGTGAGTVGGGLNRGVELSEAGSLTTSSSQMFITGTGGPGGSPGLYMDNSSAITTPATGGAIIFNSDNVSIDGTAVIATTNASSFVSFRPITATHIDLGGSDSPGTLGLSDAELDRVATSTLLVDGRGIADITITSPITRSAATTLYLYPSPGGIRSPVAGTDLSLGTGTMILNGPLACAITGPSPDSGFPQLKVSGGVNLNGNPPGDVTLNLTGTTYAGAAGNTFTIVDNDGVDPVIGTFAGLPEGAYLAWPGSPALNARISYVGGDGNDIVLTLVSAFTVVSTDSDASPGTLRGALAAAAANPGADTITFAPSLSGQSINPGTEIVVGDTGGVTLDSAGLTGGFTFSGGNASRIFRVSSGGKLGLKGFGFILGNGGGSVSNGNGGAIFNEGSLTVARSTFFNNSAQAFGGAIHNAGTLAMTNCTLTGNVTTSGNATNGGGAIFNSGTLTLAHCTVSGNFANGSLGGGLLNQGPATLAYGIVGGNSAAGGDGADIYNRSGLTRVGANIVPVLVNNGGGSVSGPAAITGAPLLAPLGAFGGVTTTMALLPGSPARDAAIGSTATTDQRGFPVVGIPDIGAYESGTPRKYATWVVENFPTNSTPTQRASTNDFDGDGRINAAEYAAMTDPTVSNSAPLLTLTLNAARTVGTNSFAIRGGALDLTYELSRSTNLTAWTTICSFTTATSDILLGPGIFGLNNGNTIVVTDTTVSGQPKTFYRLNSTVAP